MGIQIDKSIDILIGGQYGSEAKGLASWYCGLNGNYDTIISCATAQAGHTTPMHKIVGGYWVKGKMAVLRHIPSASLSEPRATIFIASGSVINIEELVKEIEFVEDNSSIKICDRLIVSNQATVILDAYIAEEKSMNLQEKIGSTLEGIGIAVSERAKRKAFTIKMILEEKYYDMDLPESSENNAHEIHKDLLKLIKKGVKFVDNIEYYYGSEIFLEGSQGYGLSTYYGHYPFCTSRNTSASGFLSAANLPPIGVRDVFAVFRTFPIRVGGNSGYMKDELSWEDINAISGYNDVTEKATITKRIRRVAKFDGDHFRKTMHDNAVTHTFLMFLNYFDKNTENEEYLFVDDDLITDKAKRELFALETMINHKFSVVSTNKYGGFWIKHRRLHGLSSGGLKFTNENDMVLTGLETDIEAKSNVIRSKEDEDDYSNIDPLGIPFDREGHMIHEDDDGDIN